MRPVTRLSSALLRIPLGYKILLANSAIVSVGAVAGTVITVWYVLRHPEEVPYLLIAVFAMAGILISFVVNRWVLRQALAPLDWLQDAVDAVRSGQAGVRVRHGAITDDRFDRLADTFNLMLAQLEDDARQLQQLSRRILQAQEEERRRLARELHDEAAQALTSLIVHLRLLERAKQPEEAQQRVVELRELTAGALEDVRRVALDLRPTILDDLGLGPALEWRVDELNRKGNVRAAIAITGLSRRLPQDTELVLYRVGQEALSNVARHSAASEVSVRLWTEAGRVHLRVCDNGCGFDPDAGPGSGRQSLGLVGMRERLGSIGGELRIDSTVGEGCAIHASAPLPPSWQQE